MKYKIGFTMTGTITVDEDDELEAVEHATLFSKRDLYKHVDTVKFEYVENKDSNTRTYL